ncbi:hypothetical protein Sru01_45300 [Sphaerisporangium rufum]|uniref:DUF2690 domain-containing protein n=1 Tax=Sphaerisporangium rufum TaxID=1381558 RepID=A0A919R5A7_9ACTN|nr:DUF2690 domain-containing protein [Sphaerisporangium rufum]GII79548.1 hypothetical protein Sru01_45300 [Sphaerisporangium rufum]
MRKFITAIACALMAVGVTTITQAPAHAASADACLAAPSAANCDGVDPSDGRVPCRNGAWMVGTAYGYPVVPKDSLGVPVKVQIQLWWSPACKSNWARIVANGLTETLPNVYLRVQASDGRTQGLVHNVDPSGLWSIMYTDLVYAPSPLSARACASNAFFSACGRYV